MFVTRNLVKSRAYQLIEPGKFQEVDVTYEWTEGHVVVEPTLGSICHADLRYFTGQRRKEALQEKLPMALIHEGIGKVINSTNPSLPVGTRVVIVPNIPGYLIQGHSRSECCSICQKENGENYCIHRRFLGSGYDGIAQSRLVLPNDCVIPIPPEVPDEFAVLAELCTVSYHALHTVSHKLSGAKVAIFGDGPVGYMTATLLKYVYGIPKERLTVFGADYEKLQQFDFATCFHVYEYDFKRSELYDIIIECTGGKFSESAINQAIDIINYLGDIILLGVSEEKVPINTRDMLEKGVTIRGSSRSSYRDYSPVLQAMKNPVYQEALQKLIPHKTISITSVTDFAKVMEEAVKKRDWKKIYLQFQW